MSSGLYLNKKRGLRTLSWISSLVFVLLLVVASWFTYKWFVNGDEPPVVPLPASALADPSVDESPVTMSMIQGYTVPSDHPRYISIPALDIEDARVQSVGLTKNNILDTPKNISDTAWFNKSATPGQGYGSVLINGHNGGISRDGIFAGLEKLQIDDEVMIERGDGEIFTYRVVENQTESLVDANTKGMQRLMTPFDSSTEGLGLITCAGKWIPRDKVFDKRIMVRAVLVK